MKKANQFIIVSLLNKKTINFRLYICITATFGLIFGGKQAHSLTFNFFHSNLSVLWFIPMLYLILKVWHWYIKKQKQLTKIVEKRLLFFLKSNNLFQTETVEKYDNYNKIKREKIIYNSAMLGYLVTSKEITIRAYKQGDIFSNKMNEIDTYLCALLDLPLENKIDTIIFSVSTKTTELLLQVQSQDTIVQPYYPWAVIWNGIFWNNHICF